MLDLVVHGQDIAVLEHEVGGHRIQRIPGNDRHGRVHSSTVTVSVIGATDQTSRDPRYQQREARAFVVSFFAGSGAGGQHRNKHQNCARIVHRPSGLVRVAQCRSREQSVAAAMAALHAELDRLAGLAAASRVNQVRRAQIGTGERADKRRTYRFQDDLVHDARTGRTASLARVMAGQFRLLW